MNNRRDVDSVMMDLQRSAGGIIQTMVFSARISFKILSFLYRMGKKELIARGYADEFKDFFVNAEGKYNTYNIPLSDDKIELINKLQSLEMELQKPEQYLDKVAIRKEIKEIEKQMPELMQLKDSGISYCLLPKVDSNSNSVQVAVAKNSDEAFKTWFGNHITSSMQGGAKSFSEMEMFTEGNYSIKNMPFEDAETLANMMHDFDIFKINYSVLPDLKVGDGYTQIAFPNSQMGLVNEWLKLYKQKLVAEGVEVKEGYDIDKDTYLNSAEVSDDEYINTSDAQYMEAQKEFEADSTSVPWKASIQKDNSERFVALNKDSNYTKITINKESLVDDVAQTEATKGFEERGYFVSRIPGTFGEKEEILVLPNENVFTTDNEKTYVAFLDKRERYYHFDGQQNLSKVACENLLEHYAQPNRGFDSVSEYVTPAMTKKQEVQTEVLTSALTKLTPNI